MKKRVCFITDSIFSMGGVQRVTAVIAKELAREADVTILTFDDPSSEDTKLYGLCEAPISYRYFRYPRTNYFVWRFCKAYSLLYRKVLPHIPLTSELYAHSSFPAAKRLPFIKELQDGHYDVIIGVHAPLAMRLATCRQALPEVRLVGWIHNSFEALFGKDTLYNIGPELRAYYEYEFAKLDATIVLSDFDARRYHCPTRVIYNPLTLVPGRPSTGTSKKFLAVGRFSHQHKGFDLLIKAFHLFARQDQEWTLDIVGEGVEEPMYRQLISDYHLEERIHIHPFTNDIQSYYSEAQVYVLSSRWEGFGLVLVEAMAHGLPIVSSDLPTSREIMGDYGLYFPVGDIEALARQLAAATRIDWPQQSQQAMQIARRFDIKHIITQWKDIIYER